MRSITFLLLLSILTNITFVNYQSIVTDQMDIELLEEKGDLENELENELKFHSIKIESFTKNYTTNNYSSSSLFKLPICQENGVSTPPPQLM